MRSVIAKDALMGKLMVIVSSKKRLRYWKQKFRSLILSRQSNASVNILFRTVDDLNDISKKNLFRIFQTSSLVIGLRFIGNSSYNGGSAETADAGRTAHYTRSKCCAIVSDLCSELTKAPH